MASYRYRRPAHGDFTVAAPMTETTTHAKCPAEITTAEAWVADCHLTSPKVLSGALQFTCGRDAFKNGPEGKGMTVRETQESWVKQAADEGRKIEPVGSRWV